MKKLILTLAVLVCAGQLFAQNQPSQLSDQQKAMMKAFHLVTPEDIHTFSYELLKDEYRGRRSGDVGYDKAAAYVIDHFKKWGLKPMGDNGTYENTFPQPYNDVQGVGHLKAYFKTGKDTIVKEYQARKDYFPTALSGNGEVSGEVVYVGYGVTAPELNYNDYKGVDVRGKIVLCEGGYPYQGKNLDTLKMWSKYQRAGAKIAAAAEAGAAGVLFISKYANPFPRRAQDDIVVAFVSRDAANELMAGTGRSLDQWRDRFKAFKAKPVFTGRTVSLAAETEFHPNTTTANIVGVIEGSDPVLKNEYIVLGAHLDHLGMLPEMYPGALDNVSGSVIMMSAAKALATSGVKMKRSVIVVLFAAEELGVLGAHHYLASLPYPKEKIACMVNVDMLGKGNGLMVNTANEWKDLVPYFQDGSENWARRPFSTIMKDWSYATTLFTDGNAFQNEKIPTIELRATGGPWPQAYHVPADTIDQLDPVIMADAARAMCIAVINIANR